MGMLSKLGARSSGPSFRCHEIAMANPIAPRLNGDDYQARHFWCAALDMLDPGSNIAGVAYEWREMKSFDDVGIFYDAPQGQAHAGPMSKHFKQVKWQTTRANRFGYLDLIDPDFINASRVSLLERLRDAHQAGEIGVRFSFVTTARIVDGDPLAELVSSEDGVINLDKLAAGKGPTSKMGKVRKTWSEALGCDDEVLLSILDGFAVLDGQPNMEAMRDTVATKARSVGLMLSQEDNAASDFRFDSLARQLIKRDIQEFDRLSLIRFLNEEGLRLAPSISSETPPTDLLIRTFDRFATDVSNYDEDHVLDLTDRFSERYLKPDLSWKVDVLDPVKQYLRQRIVGATAVRLALDAHASVAFAAGQTLHLKSGVSPELVQHGRRGREVWHADDGSAAGAPPLAIETRDGGEGDDIAICIALTRPVVEDVGCYLAGTKLPIGQLVLCHLADGASQTGVRGGEHAAMLADQIAGYLSNVAKDRSLSIKHVFVSAPNGFLFFLGQQTQSLGQVQMYEFDFDRRGGGTYVPT